jgi:hypothetical protein
MTNKQNLSQTGLGAITKVVENAPIIEGKECLENTKLCFKDTNHHTGFGTTINKIKMYSKDGKSKIVEKDKEIWLGAFYHDIAFYISPSSDVRNDDLYIGHNMGAWRGKYGIETERLPKYTRNITNSRKEYLDRVEVVLDETDTTCENYINCDECTVEKTIHLFPTKVMALDSKLYDKAK